MRWKIKRFTNDELRQKFIDATVPQGHFLGLTFPDPRLEVRRATQHWQFGEIDWAEFQRVVAGDGPCNRQRMNRCAASTPTMPGCARRAVGLRREARGGARKPRSRSRRNKETGQ